MDSVFVTQKHVKKELNWHKYQMFILNNLAQRPYPGFTNIQYILNVLVCIYTVSGLYALSL